MSMQMDAIFKREQIDTLFCLVRAHTVRFILGVGGPTGVSTCPPQKVYVPSKKTPPVHNFFFDQVHKEINTHQPTTPLVSYFGQLGNLTVFRLPLSDDAGTSLAWEQVPEKTLHIFCYKCISYQFPGCLNVRQTDGNG